MEKLSDHAIECLDELIKELDPTISFLNNKVRDKSISGQIDIQRIARLNIAYQSFLNASNN